MMTYVIAMTTVTTDDLLAELIGSNSQNVSKIETNLDKVDFPIRFSFSFERTGKSEQIV